MTNSDKSCIRVCFPDSFYSKRSHLPLEFRFGPEIRYRTCFSANRSGGKEKIIFPGSSGIRCSASDGICSFENEDLRIIFRIENNSGFIMGFTIEAIRDLLLDRVIPLHAKWPFSVPPSGYRFFQNGYQSWTPSGTVRADSAPVFSLIPAFSTMNHRTDSVFRKRKDGLLSHDFTILIPDSDSDNRESLLLGFVTANAGAGEFFLKNRPESKASITASLDYGGRFIAKGELFCGEDLFIFKGEGRNLPGLWAEELGRRMNARIPEKSPAGWSSWYRYYNRVTEKDILKNLDYLKTNPVYGIDFLQIDDGYQKRIGDWTQNNRKFIGGHASLTSKISDAGMNAGIWVAPFFAEPKSTFFREHPECFLRDEKGRLIDAGYNPVWNARLYSLDLTHPAAQDRLREVFSYFIDEGYDYFKIDFIYAGMKNGRRYDSAKSPVEAYRHGLSVIRETIGDKSFLLGCGAPLAPSTGFVDAMRISADVKENWDGLIGSVFGKGSGYPSARLALEGTVVRSFMHRRLWINDPDCLLVRERHSGLSLDEIETMVTILGMSGGMLFLSDDMTDLSEERLDMARAALPPAGISPMPPDLHTNPPDKMVMESDEGRLVALFNWSGRKKEMEVPDFIRDELCFDFWREEMRLLRKTVNIKRHGVRLFYSAKPMPHPYLAGTTFNLTASLDGRISAEWNETEKILTLKGHEMARKRGKVWIRSDEEYSFVKERMPEKVQMLKDDMDCLVLMVEAEGRWNFRLFFAKKDEAANQSL